MSFQPNKTWFTFRKEVYLLAFVLSIILLMLTTVLLSRSAVAITAEPLASPTYVYYPANVDGVTHKGRIEATGGHFGSGTTTFNLVSDGDNRYQAYFKTTAESSKDLIGQDTLTFTQCYVNAQITLNNDGTGSIKTPANLNDSSSNSEMCGYSIASQLSDLNQSSIIIATADTAMPTKDDQVFVNVHVSFSTEQQGGTFGPISLQIKDVTNNSKKYNSIDTDSFKLSDSSDAVLKATFSGVDAGAYKVCIASDDSICSSSFTKVDATASTVTIELTEDQAKAFITTDDSSTTCAIPGVGWIVCPVVNFMAWIADSAFDFIEKTYLETKTQIFNTNDINGQKTYQTWSNMRNLANVVFVIAFLVIILSQITGFGVDNYGIKKMLPRLILTALLVNVSYYACQIAIDLSNIVGNSISGVLSNMAPGSSGNTSDFWATGNVFTDMTGTILSVAVVGTASWIALPALVPVLISAVLSLLMIFLMLVARQALVVILVIIAPIAFIAFLLPNTQKLFQKWSKALGALLLLYPIIAFVFGASKWISSVMREVYAADANGIGGVIAAAVLVLPLFVVPIILKKSLDGIGGIGETVNGLRDKLNGKFGQSWSNSGMKDLMKARSENKIMNSTRRNPYVSFRRKLLQRKAERGAIIAGQQAGLERSNAEYIALQTQKDGSRLVRRMTAGADAGAKSRAVAGAVATLDAFRVKDVEAAKVLQKSMPRDRIMAIATGEEIANDADTEAAVTSLIQTGSYKERKQVYEGFVNHDKSVQDKVLPALSKEYFAKGDQQFFGATLLNEINSNTHNKNAEGKLDLSAYTKKQIINKKISPTVLVQDADATKDIVDAVELDSTGYYKNIVKEQANKAFVNPETVSKTTEAIADQLKRIAPQQQSQPQDKANPSSGDMNIPH